MASPSSSTPPRENRRQPPQGDYLTWVHRVNDRWLVHQGLNATTRNYLDYLQTADPERLQKVCRVAWALVGQGGLRQDPKPLFYGGLFSLATPEEAQRFLSDHLFTLLASPAGHGRTFESLAGRFRISQETYDKAVQLRRQITEALLTAPPHSKQEEDAKGHRKGRCP